MIDKIILFILGIFAIFLPVKSQIIAPLPTEAPLGIYIKPQIKPSPNYTIFLIGDSMTSALGPNSNRLRYYLGAKYPRTVFGIFNYSLPSTSLLSIEERFTKGTFDGDKTLPPINEAVFDVIIIESFGHNPLSEFSLGEGLGKQNEILEKTVKKILRDNPNSVIIFLSTISPNSENYAKSTRDLSPEVRASWANERTAYIKNHSKFATDHNIPLINVFDKSLNANGDGDMRYISPDDFIHPSAGGIDLISSEIANYLFENEILPKEVN